ncbi:AGAP006079-PA [Anopheles gambiae str. PEST]|uniref:AGAP006079-PA n=1 Tax=Anopheles gambiae TaxID=7165 RepID=Q7PIG3_ANOGA|nr:AGAP006079-PA [Anopheles gambiae str. PEST]
MSFRSISALVILLHLFVICTPMPECISQTQKFEVPHCCQMEELIPRPSRTKCQEKAAIDHNPGFQAYFVVNCLAQCQLEELEVIDGEELHLEKLYPLTAKFPADYRHAVRQAIDECDAWLQGKKKERRRPDGKAHCPLIGMEVENCLHRTTFSNCPNSRWKASITCNKVRQGLPFC